jgi:hypothetical protein
METTPATPAMHEPEPPPAPKGNAVLILVATLCAVFAIPFGDDRDVGFPRKYWQLHDQYLDDVAAAVAKYKDVHGRYPDNNQGLHDLDTFEARFELLVTARGGRPEPADPDPAEFFRRHFGRSFWYTISGQIRCYRAYNSRHGRDGSDIMFGPYFVIDSDLPFESNERRVRIAISQNNCFYLLGPNCVYDPSITPYGYENRNGLDGRLFANSIANSDPRRKFSREVADGVYVYSYNARHYYETYWGRLVARRGRIYGLGAIALGLWVVAAYRARKYRLGKTSLVFPAVGAILALGFSHATWATCYVTSSMPRRDPKDLDAQKRLLEQFRDSGVITAETYGKAMTGYETDAVFVPSKDPGPSRK